MSHLHRPRHHHPPTEGHMPKTIIITGASSGFGVHIDPVHDGKGR